MGYKDFLWSVVDKQTADGAQVIDLSDNRWRNNHQIRLEPSATPSAGTLSVQIKSPGASKYQPIGTIDMTDPDEWVMQFTGYAEAIRLIPAGFDAAKTYSVYGYAL